MKWLAILVVTAAAAWGAAGRAEAANCSFSISTLAFGTVDTLSGAAVNGTATLSINCTNVVLGTVRICPNIGAGSGGSVGGARQMRSSSNATLDYTMTTDLGATTLWGSIEQALLGTPPTIDLTTSLFGSISTTRTIYGKVLGGQQLAQTGNYASSFTSADVKISYSELALFNCLTLSSPVSAPFTVTADVQPNCLVTTQTVDFGSHGVIASNLDATGQVGVQCTAGTAYSVSLGNGQTGTGPTARRMVLGGSFVTYGLYRDAARSLAWGATAGLTLGGSGTGLAVPLTVYGRVPPQTTPGPGTYADIVVATVTY
jgi:spore coat protein U-like protein